MKIFLAITLAAILFYSCEKSSTGPEDEIYVFSIDKEVTLNNLDSLSLGGCSPILFQINKILNNEYSATIRLYDTTVMCLSDGGLHIMINDSGNVAALNEGYVLNESRNWGYAANLKDFAGKGEMYIGFRDFFFPSGITNYMYSWMKIELSENMDTLHIINRGINLTDNNPIKAGQME